MKVFLLVSEKNRLWVALLAILLACGATVSLLNCITSYRYEDFFQLQSKTDNALRAAMNSFALATDVALALSLIILLHRIRSGLRNTDSVVNRISVYVVSTSLVTVVVSTMAIVAEMVAPLSLSWVACNIAIVEGMYLRS